MSRPRAAAGRRAQGADPERPLPRPASSPLPTQIRDDLDTLGLVGATSARPLAGGRGGRTWKIEAAAGAFVLHRRNASGDAALRPGRVLREQRCTALAHAAGVGPEVVAADDAEGLLLTRWVPGRALTGQRLLEPDTLDNVAALLRTLHAGTLPRHRVRPADDRRRYLAAALRTTDPLAGVLLASREPLDDLVEALASTVPHDVLVHGDVVPGNVIVGARSSVLVDYEYAGRGDAAFDLGNLVASASLDRAAGRRLLRAYCADDDLDQRRRLDIRMRAWAKVAQGAWIAWVIVGSDLGPHASTWRQWAKVAAADLIAAQRRGDLGTLTEHVLDAAPSART